MPEARVLQLAYVGLVQTFNVGDHENNGEISSRWSVPRCMA